MIRNIKNKVLRKIFSSKKGKKQHLHAMQDEVLEVLKQFPDHKLCFRPKDAIGKHLYTSGDWERLKTKKTIEFLKSKNIISNKSIAIDLGANIGTQSIYFYLEGSFDKIFAIEADSYNADILSRNIALNGMEDKIFSVETAIAGHDGEISFFKSHDNSGGHSLFNHNQSSDCEKVKCQKIETIIEKNSIDWNCVDFIWSDLEGYDYECLSSVAKIGLPKAYYLEFSPKFRGREELEKFKNLISECYEEVYEFSNNDFKRINM